MSDRNIANTVLFALVVSSIIGAFIVHAVVEVRVGQRMPNPVKSECILSTDSSGCKVFRIESDGYVLFVNNQGGLVAVNSQAIYPTTNAVADIGAATRPWLTAYVHTNGFIELRRGSLDDKGRGE